jgi:hypothetical protein
MWQRWKAYYCSIHLERLKNTINIIPASSIIKFEHAVAKMQMTFFTTECIHTIIFTARTSLPGGGGGSSSSIL